MNVLKYQRLLLGVIFFMIFSFIIFGIEPDDEKRAQIKEKSKAAEAQTDEEPISEEDKNVDLDTSSQMNLNDNPQGMNEGFPNQFQMNQPNYRDPYADQFGANRPGDRVADQFAAGRQNDRFMEQMPVRQPYQQFSQNQMPLNQPPGQFAVNQPNPFQPQPNINNGPDYGGKELNEYEDDDTDESVNTNQNWRRSGFEGQGNDQPNMGLLNRNFQMKNFDKEEFDAEPTNDEDQEYYLGKMAEDNEERNPLDDIGNESPEGGMNPAVQQGVQGFQPPPSDSYSEQENPEIVNLIRTRFLHPPSRLPYQLSNPSFEDPSEQGQAKIIAQICDNKVGGRFLEAGAADGEYKSNTLYLERFLKWSGILIEAHPKLFQDLMKKNRKTRNLNTCLSPKPVSIFRGFKMRVENGTDEVEIQLRCFPLYSIMVASGLTSLDLISLRLRGNELEILQTLPWEKVDIRVITIHREQASVMGEQALKEFLKNKGYEFLTLTPNDSVFAKSERRPDSF